MLDLREHLNKHFRFQGGLDNLPILATSLRRGRSDTRGRQTLGKVMNDMGVKKMVEVGTRYGASAILWKQHIPDLDLTCIDPYRAYHRIRQESQDKIYAAACLHAEQYGFKLIRKASLDAVDDFEDESLDAVNIDDDHTFDACVQGIIRWARKVKKGGLVLVHDYCAFGLSGVMWAVNGYTHSHKIDPWFVTRDLEPTAFWQRGAEKAGLGS
jgi:predicted O-methyltransferase YrrM